MKDGKGLINVEVNRAIVTDERAECVIVKLDTVQRVSKFDPGTANIVRRMAAAATTASISRECKRFFLLTAELFPSAGTDDNQVVAQALQLVMARDPQNLQIVVQGITAVSEAMSLLGDLGRKYVDPAILAQEGHAAAWDRMTRAMLFVIDRMMAGTWNPATDRARAEELAKGESGQ